MGQTRSTSSNFFRNQPFQDIMHHLHNLSVGPITDTDITIELSAVDEREAQGAGEGGRDRRRIFCL